MSSSHAPLTLLSVLLSVLAWRSPTVAVAQPVPVEVFGGHAAVNTQLIVARPLRPDSKFGVFALVNYNLPHDRADAVANNFIIQTLGTYRLTEHLRIMGGTFVKTVDFGPTAGLQAAFPMKRGLLLLSNRYEFASDFRTELFALLELRPRLTEALTGYLRLQAMIETNFSRHERGFQTVRAGLSAEPFTYGLGFTYDQFGPTLIPRGNAGVFVGVEL